MGGGPEEVKGSGGTAPGPWVGSGQVAYVRDLACSSQKA